jgi:hypothetical protein
MITWLKKPDANEISPGFEDEPVGDASIGFQPLRVSATMAALFSFSDNSVGNWTGDSAWAQETNDGARVEDRARAIIGFFAGNGSRGNRCGAHDGPG